VAKVLIVDDSSVARTHVRASLEGGGHTVIDACDGKVGLSLLQKTPDVDLVIVDLHMPNMDGLSMTEAIRNDPKLAGIPVVLFTAETGPTAIETGRKVGVTAWLSKPQSADGIRSAVAKVTNRQKGASSP